MDTLSNERDGTILSDQEARAMVAELLVIDSARAAGLSVAHPMDPGRGQLVVFESPNSSHETGAVRRVGIEVVPAGPGSPEALPEVRDGELLALVEWDEVNGPGSVLLVAANDSLLRQGWRRWVGRRLASPELWRVLVRGDLQGTKE